jgi:hypothetical protein
LADVIPDESLVDMVAASSAARISPAKMLGVYSRMNTGPTSLELNVGSILPASTIARIESPTNKAIILEMAYKIAAFGAPHFRMEKYSIRARCSLQFPLGRCSTKSSPESGSRNLLKNVPRGIY